ncbi:class I SAM-dependent methyltransferase [Mycolicibacterium phlei]|uniref:O-methyltransferase n=1 Tax=Mycolicibacterium phlei DSM 43239 = CCUG 21000 TaxID=1226750 RepID=A0A5N5US86_MYCPH|nr:class I SAM-dependent methyltransferase [Mycolicibacterium phlei]EID13103.1 O-methyltransferase involved in polyketide biosynthesis [Mycolicibacterium phlei RIVM601174]KAB7751977.1 O-methyltransferase [Mycolicibacterium phlei DSM 43239 = CCUG 21000]KXW59566.1 O-methyltransferase [Mycolicibacterium phlei DSM 43072]KXW60574.1 O-methyltransferase [Mycolicibacterium phlei DSM 43239 = CCUG 21000]KXW74184.1 O-methyltransferase [Mycolicibacterium phlei DSM 43070]
MSSTPPAKVDGRALTGVSETALMTLQVRANEARRRDALIDDPMAVRLADSIDFDYAKFGPSRRQDMAIRSLAFDKETRRYLRDHPKATVVALAEGLQTSFYRIDATDVGHEFRWLTVDLPPMVELRSKLLPESDRVRMLAQSALDYSWADEVDTAHGVFITAEGLLMYLQPHEALGLIAECAARFPGGRMMFDLAPMWFAKLATSGLMRPSLGYRVPPMPFSMTPGQIAKLVDEIPGIRAVHDVPMPPGRGAVMNAAMWTMQRLPLFDPIRPVFTLLEFG